jgi:DMSO/TMAO reductase YedYZ molybdopterin-dependent catalytic subunit
MAEKKLVSGGWRVGLAGIAGALVAFGTAELVHGLYNAVPSVFVAIAQLVIELTPGGLATQAIEALGTADIPVLISCLIAGALVVAVLLARLALKRPVSVLFYIGILAVIALIACFREPFISPIPTVLTVIGALALGVTAAAFLLEADTEEATEPLGETPVDTDTRATVAPTTMDVRQREAHSTGGMWVPRKNFLLLSGATALAGLAAAGVGRTLSGAKESLATAPKKLEIPGASDKPSSGGSEEGQKTADKVTHETLPPVPEDAEIKAPGMVPIVTPAAEFYLIDAALSSPQVNVDKWSLSVKGAVDNPIELSYTDLLDMSTREADITLSCVSNEVGGGLISNGRWTGVLLSDVLAEAGVSRDKISRASEQLVGRSVDGWTSGFRTSLALDGREALVAFGLNGSELPVKHGYPVRLVVPGVYGYVSATKWLQEIELTNWDFDAYWIQRTWAKEGPIKTHSRIDTVKDGANLAAGTIQIGGVAWAPHKGIDRVEVSTDSGESWDEARLATQIDKDTWRHYMYDWDAGSGEYTIQVRATDGEGQTQTSKKAAPHPSGASGYHTVSVTVA